MTGDPVTGDPVTESRAIVLLSGGLDSVVAAAMWMDRGSMNRGSAVTLCLGFDYGQSAVERELTCAQRFAERRGLPFCRIALPWLQDLAALAGCALVGEPASLPTGSLAAPGDARSAEAVWVPARNAVFVAVAAAHAEAAGADAIVAGFNREEAATFPDNSEQFVAAANAFLGMGTRSAIRLQSPTIGLDKVQIVAEARRLGIARADLWSCYRGEQSPCGRCESCLRSAAAWG